MLSQEINIISFKFKWRRLTFAELEFSVIKLNFICLRFHKCQLIACPTHNERMRFVISFSYNTGYVPVASGLCWLHAIYFLVHFHLSGTEGKTNLLRWRIAVHSKLRGTCSFVLTHQIDIPSLQITFIGAKRREKAVSKGGRKEVKNRILYYS